MDPPCDVMVKLTNKKRKWAIDQIISGKKSIQEVAEIYNVSDRWIQILVRRYRITGEYPVLNRMRRPKIELTDEEKELIDKAVKESGLTSAVHLRLYIDKHHNKTIPYNKIHKHLLKQGLSKEDPKKKKQRKYCKYERDHSFSLVHLDWHESKVIEGKQVCVVFDDASRNIICGGEFDEAIGNHNIKLMKQAIEIAWEKYSSIIRETNTDKGPQFYCNISDKNGIRGRTEFELFLAEQGINHIPSRRNHPQTNGKNERWFRTYEENRGKFKTFGEFVDWYNDRIHLGLNRKKGVTPNEAIGFKLQPGSVVGLFFRRFE
jgi:putative transposase